MSICIEPGCGRRVICPLRCEPRDRCFRHEREYRLRKMPAHERRCRPENRRTMPCLDCHKRIFRGPDGNNIRCPGCKAVNARKNAEWLETGFWPGFDPAELAQPAREGARR